MKTERENQQFEKREYPEFAGKIIDYIDGNGEITPVIVVACDYYIGCTVVAEADHTDYFRCCIGPNAPLVKKVPCLYESQADIEEWDSIFRGLVFDITAGVMDDSIFDQDSIVGGRVGPETCPFR